MLTIIPRCDLALVDGRQYGRGYVQHAVGDAGKGVKDCQWAVTQGYLHHWPAAHIHQPLKAAGCVLNAVLLKEPRLKRHYKHELTNSAA